MRKIYCWRGHIFTTLSTNQSARLFRLLLGLKATAPQVVVGGGQQVYQTVVSISQMHLFTCFASFCWFIKGDSELTVLLLIYIA